MIIRILVSFPMLIFLMISTYICKKAHPDLSFEMCAICLLLTFHAYNMADELITFYRKDKSE